MSQVLNFEELVEDGKNKNTVKCQHCGSKILAIKAANFVEKQIELPLAKQRDVKVSTLTEKIEHFFLVIDMYTFENIGFSHTVGNVKYLTCADCEMGPLGYHDLETKESFVALSRVVC